MVLARWKILFICKVGQTLFVLQASAPFFLALCVRALHQGECLNGVSVVDGIPSLSISSMFFRIIAQLDYSFAGGSFAGNQNKPDTMPYHSSRNLRRQSYFKCEL